MLAGFIQGLTGFGFGIVAMSLWVWWFDPQVAAVITVFGALSGQIIALIKLRRELHLRAIYPFLLGALAGVPIGTLLLPEINPDIFKAIVGTVLTLWCPAMVLTGKTWHVHIGGKLAEAVIGVIGGILGGLCGMTGIAPALWGNLKRYDKTLLRNLLQNFNLATLFMAMLSYVLSGAIQSFHPPLMATALAALLVPTLLGIKTFKGISEAQFRIAVQLLLTLSGLALLTSSVSHLMH